jgi:hypothetical protein
MFLEFINKKIRVSDGIDDDVYTPHVKRITDI